MTIKNLKKQQPLELFLKHLFAIIILIPIVNLQDEQIFRSEVIFPIFVRQATLMKFSFEEDLEM